MGSEERLVVIKVEFDIALFEFYQNFCVHDIKQIQKLATMKCIFLFLYVETTNYSYTL